PDGALVALGSTDSCARLWDTRTGTIRIVLENLCGTTAALAFSSDGRHLLTGGDSRTVVLWDVETGHQILSVADFNAAIRSLAFSFDHQRFATASRDKRVVIWDARTGSPLLSLGGSRAKNVNTVAFNRSGTLILTGDVTGSISVWDAINGQLL